MTLPCSGVILAGGLNRRFSGANKAFFSINGKMVFDSLYDLFADLFEETILVTNDPLPFLDWDIDIVTDMFQIRSPLIGIHAGLFAAKFPYVFVAACDTPFLKKNLIKAVVGEIDSSYDVLVPETPDGLQPLCAVYSKQCLKVLDPHLEAQERNSKGGDAFQKGLKIQYLFQKVRVKKLTVEMLRDKDPDLISFFNVNTPDDLAKAKEMAKKAAFKGLDK